MKNKNYWTSIKNKRDGKTIVCLVGVVDTKISYPLFVAVNEEGLAGTSFSPLTSTDHVSAGMVENKIIISRLEDALVQFDEFFSSKRKKFTLPINWSLVSPFSEHVLKIVGEIPYGEVRTYKQIAALCGIPKAPRAIGAANAHNPFPVIIPCHRVVGTDGGLHGFSSPGGLDTKAQLLALEGIRTHQHHLIPVQEKII